MAALGCLIRFSSLMLSRVRLDRVVNKRIRTRQCLRLRRINVSTMINAISLSQHRRFHQCNELAVAVTATNTHCVLDVPHKCLFPRDEGVLQAASAEVIDELVGGPLAAEPGCLLSHSE